MKHLSFYSIEIFTCQLRPDICVQYEQYNTTISKNQRMAVYGTAGCTGTLSNGAMAFFNKANKNSIISGVLM